jgi:hypothetical protein
VDTSGNGYNMTFGGGDGSQGGDNLTSDSVGGVGAVQFHNGDGGSAGYLGWSNPTPPGLLSALAGSFSVSCWNNTTQSNFGWDQAPANQGAGIVSADNNVPANDVIPMALTGNKIGFNTGGDSGDVTLNSTASVNDGNYHHIVVTRNQQTGQKIIYIDGLFDSFSSGTTNLLNAPQKVTIGALADAGNPDPNDGSYHNGYDGNLDDLQIYSGVLSAREVASLHANPGSAVANGGGLPSGGHTNIAHYAFDNSGYLGQDASGSGNDMNGASWWGPQQQFSTNAEAGGGAVQFFGASCLSPGGSALASWDTTLGGSFTISAWVKTTNSVGNPSDDAISGATLFWAYNDQNNTNDTIPLSLTGGKLAFLTRDHLGRSTTLHSATSVNDGKYHLITVTRDQASGQKSVYVDGSLETTELGTTEPLNGNNYFLSIGGTTSSSYTGLADDVQIYSGVLSPGEVAYLYNHPGTNVADTSGADFNYALNTTGLTWTSSGDAIWFVETSNTHDGISAAQSGSVTNTQTSVLSTTVTGPGTLTFYWSSIANDLNLGFSCEFDVDGYYSNNITGNTAWQQAGPYTIASGTHTLSWTAYAGGDTDPTQAGFLDQASFVLITNANTSPIITISPFSQTNYPGYGVALLAAATSNPAATWQWYKVGNPSPIPDATNALYIPTNSGTAGVAGSYYAVASNLVGTAVSTTATVSFASAPLPPDWALAFKTPLFNNASDITTNYNIACLVDSTGTNIYTVGSIVGTNLFGSDTLISPNGVFGSSFLKQTTTGTALWGRCITNNGNGSSYAQCVAAAPGGGIYASGDFFGTNWLGTNKLADVAGGSTYLVRFDANGNLLWVQTIAGTNSNFTEYHDLTADPAGNVTLSALISGGTRVGTSNVFVTGQRGVLAQFDSSGNLRWLQLPSSWPGNLTYSGGCIYGSMGGSATNYIGGVTNLSDRSQALFSLNATNGQANWVRGFAAQNGQGNPFGFSDDGALVAVSGTNVFVAGNAWGSNAVFGPFTVSFATAKGQYLARYDTNGNPQLATSFGSEYTWPWTIRADTSGSVYIGSDFDTYSIFGNDIIAAPFYETVQSLGSLAPGARIPGQTCVAKFDRNGNLLWARLAQSQSSYLNSRDIALASDGVWSCGFFNQQSLFGTNTINGGLTCIGTPICTLQYHPSGYLAKVTDTSAVAPWPITLLNPQNNGATFQFSFQSQSGFTHSVLYRTNLVAGLNWQTYSNVIGDGTLKTISVPLSVFSPAKQGFIRVSTP